jgi:hypothetical protein
MDFLHASFGLRIYHVSHPAIPTMVAYYNPSEIARGIAVSSNYVYLANDGGWIA